jgi:APA family basic amino acid/polyamine antiporter
LFEPIRAILFSLGQIAAFDDNKLESTNNLKRQLGLRTAVALIVGEVIAAGIFLTPAGMTKSLGSPFWLLVVWVAMGAAALCGAFCYAELAGRFPAAGGGYVYLREAFGRPIAFLYGWKVFLVLDPGLTAALAVGLASYASYRLPMSPVSQKATGIAAVLILAAANIVGVRLGARVIQALTAVKLILLSLLAAWGLLSMQGTWNNFHPLVAQHTGSDPLILGLAAGLVGGFFAFGGWWDVSKMAGEMRDPRRDLQRALFVGILIVTFFYILMSAVFVYLVPTNLINPDSAFVAQVGEVLGGPIGGRIVSSIVVVIIFGSLAAYLMVAPRVYYALASDGLFFRQVARVHPRFGTPALAIALQATFASILVAIGNFDQIVAYFFFVTVLFLALTIVAVFVLRLRHGRPEGYAATLYPLSPIIFLVIIGILLFLLAMKNPKQSFLGVAVVLCGLPFYYLLFRKKKSVGL